MYKLDRYLGTAPKKLQRSWQENTPIRPLSVKIKLTWHCNLRCIMCSEWRIQGKPPPRPNYFDSWDKLQAVLDDLIALKTKKVHFSGGEPLMSPYLDQAVSYLHRQGKHVSLVSNGTLWTASRARNLIQAGLSSITFSIDSFDPDTFRAIRGQNSWSLLIKGLGHVREAAAASLRPVKLRANLVITNQNYLELGNYLEQAAQLGIQQVRFLPVDDLHTEQRSLRLNPVQIEAFNRIIAPQLAEQGQALGLLRSNQQAYPFGRGAEAIASAAAGHYAQGFYQNKACFAPWLHSLIAADGKVYGCCMLKGEKISIAQLGPGQSFDQIWNGSEYQAFRTQMQASKYSICQHCDDYLVENRYLNQLLESQDRRNTLRTQAHLPTESAADAGCSL